MAVIVFIVTPQTVSAEVSFAYRHELAKALRIQPEMVGITWEPAPDGGGVRPVVRLEFPPALPPSHVDPADPEAMARWRDEVATLPGMMDFLKAKGVDDPARIVRLYVELMMAELRKRLKILQEHPA